MQNHPSVPSTPHPIVTLVCSTALALAAALSCGIAHAATTGASADARAPGVSAGDRQSAPGTVAIAHADLVIPNSAGDAFITAEAFSVAGQMGMGATARSSGAPGGFQATARATWDDSFTILASPSLNGTVGSFSGAVWITGGLSVLDFSGRYYGDTSVGASVDIFPGTGFNGGRTLKQGGARYVRGYDIVASRTGSEGFGLSFEQVPFTFGGPIAITVSMNAFASISIIDARATARAEAAYGHTLYWGGLSAVQDATGHVLRPSEYQSISSTSGFDFARPVPEPGSAGLLGLGLLVFVGRRQLRRIPVST